MHSVEHTLGIISENLGMRDLYLNRNGQVELVFQEKLIAHITQVAATEMEISFQLPRLLYARPSMMRAMLTANFLGNMTGPGRLAIDPVKEEVIYCERWDVASMSAEDVDRRLADFIKHGAYWLTEGTDDLIEMGREDVLGLDRLFADWGANAGDEDDDASSRNSSEADEAIMIRL